LRAGHGADRLGRTGVVLRRRGSGLCGQSLLPVPASNRLKLGQESQLRLIMVAMTRELPKTTDTISPPVTGHGKVMRVAAVAALGGFLFGYDTAVINGAVDAVQSRFGTSNIVISFVVSSALLGCAVGAWFAGPLGDRFGRIKIMVAAAALF